jgi:hypothetical protein
MLDWLVEEGIGEHRALGYAKGKLSPRGSTGPVRWQQG